MKNYQPTARGQLTGYGQIRLASSVELLKRNRYESQAVEVFKVPKIGGDKREVPLSGGRRNPSTGRP